ncbi:MAG: Tyrosine recombinase XerC [Fimbriimonadaceae bacterium]|nr:Tyrosine recombinase XerC [Fimbriimonadaceae bacterium]
MARRERREKGSGSIFRRGEGYVAQVQDGFTSAGKPKYKQVRCKTRTDAVRTLNELTSLLVQGKGLPGKNGYSVASWLDVWLQDHIRPHRESKTYDFYQLMANKYVKPHLGRLDLPKVTPSDVSRLFTLIEANGATFNTIQAVRRTLRAAYGVAVKYGLVHDNPVSKTFAPKIQRAERIHFTAEQVQRLLDALRGSPIENLVRFTLATGMRIGEASGVTWSAVNLERRAVLVKTQLQRVNKDLVLKPLKTEKSARTIPLVGHSLAAVQSEQERQSGTDHANTLDLVFLNPRGCPFDPKYVNDHLHDALATAGLPRTGMHTLRHSAATFMLMAGLNLHQVSRYLGHSQIALTSNLYGHVLDDAMRDAAEQLQASYVSTST